MIEWLSIVSLILPIAIGVVGWLFTRIVSRLDSLERRIGEMSTAAADRDAKQDTRLNQLEKTSLTRDDLRDVIETALAKSVAPITQELKAITINSQHTRERLVRLEATFEARSD